MHPFFSLGFSCFVLLCFFVKVKLEKKEKNIHLFIFLMNFTKLWLGYCSQLIQPAKLFLD